MLLAVTTGNSVLLRVARHCTDLHLEDVNRLCRVLGVEPTFGGSGRLLIPAHCLPDLGALAQIEGIVIRDMARKARGGRP